MVMQLENNNYQSAGSAPRAKHYDKDLAVSERNRLARAHRGITFVLLEAMEMAQVSDLTVTAL